MQQELNGKHTTTQKACKTLTLSHYWTTLYGQHTAAPTHCRYCLRTVDTSEWQARSLVYTVPALTHTHRHYVGCEQWQWQNHSASYWDNSSTRWCLTTWQLYTYEHSTITNAMHSPIWRLRHIHMISEIRAQLLVIHPSWCYQWSIWVTGRMRLPRCYSTTLASYWAQKRPNISVHISIISSILAANTKAR